MGKSTLNQANNLTPDNSGSGHFLLPTKEILTQQQVDCLLGVAATLRDFIALPEDTDATLKALDGGAKCAALATFNKVCDRLDSIVDDSTRWNLDGHSKLMESISETYRLQVEFTKTQMESSRQLQRPAFRLQPTLAILGDCFVAYWGDLDTVGRAIIGKGATPNEALADFDKAFDRMPNAQIYLIAETKGVPIIPPPAPEDHPKKPRRKKP